MKRSWVEISRRRLLHNVKTLRRRLPSSSTLIAVVKANAYGHGLKIAAGVLHQAGVNEFAVANLREAVQLRGCAPSARILVLGGCLPGEELAFRDYRLVAAHYDVNCRPVPGVPYELKIDSGMTRLGVPWTLVATFLESCAEPPAGVFSHFASADTDPEFSRLQLQRFLECTSRLECPRHIAASEGLRFPEAVLDKVRVGLALYGVPPVPELTGLKAVLSWKALVLQVQEVPAGTAVGYGGTWVTEHPSRLAVLSVGYADGYDRRFSNRGSVSIGGRLAPVAGRVSMDLTTVDVTQIPEVKPGDEAVLLEPDEASPLSANRLARVIGTIPYELLTSIGARVERIEVS